MSSKTCTTEALASSEAVSKLATTERPAGSPTEANLHAQAITDRRRRHIIDQTLIAIGRSILIVVLIGGWGLASGRWLDAETISNPFAVLDALRDLIATGRIWPELAATLSEVFTGYFAGTAAGAGLALVFAFFPSAERIMRPFLLAVYSIPKIALAPLVVMWFGLGIAPKIILAGMFVFFIVFMNAASGIQSVNKQFVSILQIMGAGRFAIVFKVVLPTMLPFLLLGLRVSIPEAMTGAVIGEFISANHGLGYLIYSASNELNMAISFAALVVLVFVVAIGDFVLGMVERALPWQAALVHAAQTERYRG